MLKIILRNFKQALNTLRPKYFNNAEKKPYACDKCEKRYVYACSLKVHKMQIHTGEKPLKCNECGKRFTYFGSLALHKLMHSGEKPV